MAAVQDKKTTKVKLNTSISGHRFDEAKRYVGDYAYASGDSVELPADEAKRFIERGMASPVANKE